MIDKQKQLNIDQHISLFFFKGYKIIHRNVVQKRLNGLFDSYRKSMITDLSNISSLSVTADFWSDRRARSYLVLTGHYVDDNFHSNSTILQFSTFDKRHFSDVIGKEIEKQLKDLGTFEKVTAITCDNAPNMLGLFQYLSREIKHVPCMAHILHLVICNGLCLWKRLEEHKGNIQHRSADSEGVDRFDGSLSQSVKTMTITTNDNEQEDRNDSQDARSDDFNVNVSLFLFLKQLISIFVTFDHRIVVHDLKKNIIGHIIHRSLAD